MTMRVIHLAAGRQFGGVERLLVGLAGGADGQGQGGIQPIFVLCYEGRLAKELRAMGAEVFVLGGARLSRPWTVWKLRRRLMRLLRKIQGDLVVTHGCWPHALGGKVVRRRRLPLVFWAHEVMEGGHWLEKWAGLTRPDCVVVGSRLVREGVGRVFGVVRTELLRCAVAAPGPLDKAAVRRETREEMGTANGRVVIVMVARMDGIKGHGVLLDALARLKDAGGNWECWMVGGAETAEQETYLRGLKGQAEALGLNDRDLVGGEGNRVTFLGNREDVGRLLAGADIYCQPNTGPEAFGIAFIEAMDAGLAVVTSGIGGALEIVDEHCGLLLPPGDVGRLAEVLRQLIEDEGLRRRLGSAGPARARMLCDPTARERELEGILQSVLDLLASAV